MKEFYGKIISSIKKRYVVLILLTTIYIFGFIIGFIFKSNYCNKLFYENVFNYNLILTNINYGIFQAFFKCLSTGILLTFSALIIGFTIYTMPILCVVLLYRGIMLANLICGLYALSSVSGILVFILVALPINLIITLGLIVSATLNFDHSINCRKVTLISPIKNCLISIFTTLIASFYLTIILFFIIRPLNLFF